jgi:hypothetical protein
MSTQKLTDASKIYIQEHPYTQIFNNVIDYIKDNDAFRLYCYLSSKSRDWKVAKEWTAKQCEVGERKSKQCWAYLERCGLLEYVHKRDENGKFIHHDIRILNGSEFNPDEPFLKPTGAETAPVEKLSTETPHHRCKNPPSGETTRVVFAPQLKKDITKKDFETKKRKSFCAPAQKKTKSQWREENAKRHGFADRQNDEQMQNETKRIEEHEARKGEEMKGRRFGELTPTPLVSHIAQQAFTEIRAKLRY